MKKSLKFAIVIILALLATLLIVSCGGGGGVENTPAVVAATKAFQIYATNESYDTLALAIEALQKKSVSKDVTPWTIKLTRDVTDAGATVSGISKGVVIDFQSYTYTLTSGSSGIIINNGTNEVEISGGTIQVPEGSTLSKTAVITSNSDLKLSGTTLSVNASVNAIESTSGKVSIGAKTTITTKDEKDAIVASNESEIKVTDSEVTITGGLKLSQKAEVDLGQAIYIPTKPIEKDPESTFKAIEENIQPKEGSGVEESNIEEVLCNHTFSEEWTHDENNHWHVATCEHTQLKGSYENHTWGEGVITTAPGCTTVGIRTYYCKCGLSYSEEVDSLGHDFVSVVTEPTATSEGFTTHTCSRCDYSYVDGIVPAIGYIFGSPNWNWYDNNTRVEAVFTSTNVPSYSVTVEGTVTVEDSFLPTCTQKGHASLSASVNFQGLEYTSIKNVNYPSLGHNIEHFIAKAPTCAEVGWNAYESCTRCDYTTYYEIPALGHDLIHHEAKAPTCTADGWNAYETCSRCDYTTYVGIPALTHSIIHHEAKAATCTEIGWNAYDTCSECDYSTYVEIPALGHNLTQHNAQAATCTAGGWNAYDTCSRCEYSTYVAIPALGHNLVHHDAQESTCTSIGWNAYDTCSRCDYTTYVEIPALGHDLTHHNAQMVNCTEIGWSAYDTCSRCDYSTYVEIPALGHDLIHHNAQTETCTDIGWNAYDTCSRCDYTTYVEMPALGHDLMHHNAQTETCTEIGWNAYDTCSRCDYTTYVEIPALGHNWNDGEWSLVPTHDSEGIRLYICDTCGEHKNVDVSRLYYIGETGPAGGIVFYDCDADNEIDPQSGIELGGLDGLVSYRVGWRYLEGLGRQYSISSHGLQSNPPDYYPIFGYIGIFRGTLGTTKYVNGTSTYNQLNCTGTAIGSGKHNTELLLEAYNRYGAYWETQTMNGSAARTCDNFSREYKGVIYDDWFLPSVDELEAFISLGGFSSGYTYWSSSESTPYPEYVWVVGKTPNGVITKGTSMKGNGKLICPIREFL